ncbi:MAG: flagellar hook-associated protein FlgK [Desulfobacteraceae bacterium]|nr:flagellar hook-associated protein FlgK [Desulfobacteraceae bacterium]
MPGLTSLLNVADVALLAQQLNLQTTGNNIANVSTDGYSRQTVSLSPNFPTPSSVGPIGNGVMATDITRAYDSFVNMSLFNETSVNSGLQAQDSGMQLVQGVLNEVDTNGLNGLLNNFWTGWSNLANNAEGSSERTSLLQQASLLASGINDRYNALTKLSNNVDLNINSAVNNINQLADQIADINVRILSMESGGHKANDLRDQRDELIKQLSQLANIHYFETQQGTYTVLIGSGSPLVEGTKSQHLSYASGGINWLGPSGQVVPLTNEDISGGTLGGWMDIKSRISPPDTTTLTSSQANTTAGRIITGATKWNAIDGVNVTGNFTITFSGTTQSGLPVSGTYTDSSGTGAGTVNDFMNSVKAAFAAQGSTIDMYVDTNGRLVVKDTNPGNFPISFKIQGITGGVTGLNLGSFDGRYPPNYLDQLNNWASELIKTVNSQHSQGVGLIPLTETTADNAVVDTAQPISYKSSGLKFSDSVQTGSFNIWLYDANGNPIDLNPATPGVNDPLKISVTQGVTTLADIQNAINSANVGLTASMPGGKLVISANGQNGAAGFAFGADTSGALTALGLNSFFTGSDAGTIGVNQNLLNDPRLVAAAQAVNPGSNQAVSGVSVTDQNRPLVTNFSSGTIKLWVYDANGQLVDMNSSTPGIDPVSIPIDPSTNSISDIVNAINNVSGLSASIDSGQLKITSTNSAWKGFTLEDSSGVLSYLGLDSAGPVGTATGLVARQGVTDPTASLNSAASGLPLYGSIQDGSFIVRLYDSSKNLVNTQAVNLSATDSLNTLVTKLNAVPGVSASIDSLGHLIIQPSTFGDSIALDSDTSGALGALGLDQISTSATGAYAVPQGVSSPISSLSSGVNANGKFNIYLYDANGNSIGTNSITVTKYDSLSDIAKKIDANPGLTASINNGKLTITAQGGTSAFALGEDPLTPSGLLAALDISTPKGGVISPADNKNALAINGLSSASLAGLNGASLNGAYQSLVGTVGIDAQGIVSDYAFSQTAVNTLQARRDSVSAVSLDEEMANLVKFQQAYTAAAKLINVANDLFASLLQSIPSA